MAAYEYIKLSTGEGIHLFSTDRQTVEQLLTEANRYVKYYQTGVDRLPSGEMYHWHIHHFEEKECDLYWWVVKWLCERGWEPFPVGGGYNTPPSTHFRRSLG